jgi:imidazolonepropionase-like amidohydrolase
MCVFRRRRSVHNLGRRLEVLGFTTVLEQHAEANISIDPLLAAPMAVRTAGRSDAAMATALAGPSIAAGAPRLATATLPLLVRRRHGRPADRAAQPEIRPGERIPDTRPEAQTRWMSCAPRARGWCAGRCRSSRQDLLEYRAVRDMVDHARARVGRAELPLWSRRPRVGQGRRSSLGFGRGRRRSPRTSR